MSVTTFTDSGRMPVLIADSLISGPDDESMLRTPDHPQGISDVFPSGSGFVPTRLARKTALINPHLAIAMVGSVVHMGVFREDVRDWFRDRARCWEGDVERFLRYYEADDHGIDVLANIDVLVLCTRPVERGQHLYHLKSAGASAPHLVEVKSRNLGMVLATGCGAEELSVAVDAIDSYAFGGTGSTKDWSAGDEAVARNLALIARLHRVDELTGQMLMGYWGGGYEVIHRQMGGGLTYLKDYTIFFWTLDLEDNGAEYQPDGFIKYERQDDFSVLLSYRRGQFNTNGMVDVGTARKPISIRPDEEYLNSDIHMNVVCGVRGAKTTAMYFFCHRYRRGESNPSMAFLRNGRVEVAVPVQWGRELSRFIHQKEDGRNRKARRD